MASPYEMIPGELLAELTQALIDANTLLEDSNRAHQIAPDLGMESRKQVIRVVRERFFRDIPMNQPLCPKINDSMS